MPTLPNAKHERFAQALADGRTQIDAHGAAGFRPHRGNASSLAQDKNIAARVSEILAEREEMHKQATAQAISATGLTKQWIIDRLTDNARLAAANEDFGPSNKALELLGKELGMFVENMKVRSDVAVTRKPDDLPATDRWLEELSIAGATPALPKPVSH